MTMEFNRMTAISLILSLTMTLIHGQFTDFETTDMTTENKGLFRFQNADREGYSERQVTQDENATLAPVTKITERVKVVTTGDESGDVVTNATSEDELVTESLQQVLDQNITLITVAMEEKTNGTQVGGRDGAELGELVTKSDNSGEVVTSGTGFMKVRGSETNERTEALLQQQVTTLETTRSNNATTHEVTMLHNVMIYNTTAKTTLMNMSCETLGNISASDGSSNNTSNSNGCKDKNGSRKMKDKHKVDYIGYITTPIFFSVGIVGKYSISIHMWLFLGRNQDVANEDGFFNFIDTVTFMEQSLAFRKVLH